MALFKKRSGSRRISPRMRERRRSQLVPILGFIAVCLGLAWFFESQATTTLIFVRHADTDMVMSANADPSLNGVGRQRAELLADFFEDIDVIASVDTIYASELRRTQETAAPLSERLGIEVNIADHYQVGSFMDQILKVHKGEIVLVVTHSDIIAPLVEELHGSKNIPVIEQNEYHNIYVVTIPWFGKVKTLRLHYGLAVPIDFGPRLSRDYL